MRLAGHRIRHTDEIANKLVLWQPTEGRTSRGKGKITYTCRSLAGRYRHGEGAAAEDHHGRS